MRRPTIRFAYWIGIRRWPSWMKTIAATIASAISGKKSFSIGPPLHQARDRRSAAPVRIDAKIRSEMPLPTPRFVISSPIHISSVVADGERDDDQVDAGRCSRRARPGGWKRNA